MFDEPQIIRQTRNRELTALAESVYNRLFDFRDEMKHRWKNNNYVIENTIHSLVTYLACRNTRFSQNVKDYFSNKDKFSELRDKREKCLFEITYSGFCSFCSYFNKILDQLQGKGLIKFAKKRYISEINNTKRLASEEEITFLKEFTEKYKRFFGVFHNMWHNEFNIEEIREKIKDYNYDYTIIRIEEIKVPYKPIWHSIVSLKCFVVGEILKYVYRLKLKIEQWKNCERHYINGY